MKVLIAGTDDLKSIETILNHPDVFSMVTDDLSPSRFTADFENSIYIINEDRTGVIRLDPMSSTCCSAHIATLPKLKGKGKEFAKSVINLGFTVTRFTTVLMFVPEFNKPTNKLCAGLGFKKQCVIENSFLKDWKYHNQIVYSLNKYKRGNECRQQ